ncbi:MAG: hypothetical protein IT308_04325 [Anaerolineaceae bacterium]|nr:hypothetical protein [Anaerolineaceae bacterium]
MNKKKLLVPLLVLMFASLACSFGGIGKEEALAPTATPVNTAVPEAPIEKSFYDDFSTTQSTWGDLKVVTTQAKPGQMKTSAKYEDGKMIFEFRDLETYAYKFNQNRSQSNVVLEAQILPTGHTSNGMALVCRANSDLTEWYEARLSSTSQYWLFRYDAALREKDQNPYVLIKQGSLPINVFYPAKPNVVRFTCQDNNLKLESNGQEVISTSDGALTKGGLAGIGAMSHEILPVAIQFDYFSYGQP